MAKQVITDTKDSKQTMREFEIRRWRQITAMTAALVLLLVLAMLYRRFDIATNDIYVLQGMVIAAFIGFSYRNWRCPACKKYIGGDIGPRRCKHCGVAFR